MAATVRRRKREKKRVLRYRCYSEFGNEEERESREEKSEEDEERKKKAKADLREQSGYLATMGTEKRGREREAQALLRKVNRHSASGVECTRASVKTIAK